MRNVWNSHFPKENWNKFDFQPGLAWSEDRLPALRRTEKRLRASMHTISSKIQETQTFIFNFICIRGVR